MKSTFALSSAALLAVAQAQNAILVGDLSEDVSSEQWSSVAEEPNLTAKRTFTGRDISSSFPGSSQEGWELTLAVKDDLEVPDDAEDVPEGQNRLTATTVSLTGPDGETEMDDSWRVCLTVFPVNDGSAGGWGSDMAPDCSGAVATECVEDLRKQGRKNFGPDCEGWKITPSCLRDLQEQKGHGIAINSDNAENMLGNSSFFRRVEDTHPENDDMASLQAAAARAVAVVNVFGPSGDSDEEPYAEVRCMMPNTVAEGADDPFPESMSTPAASKFFGWAALTGAVAAFFL